MKLESIVIFIIIITISLISFKLIEKLYKKLIKTKKFKLEKKEFIKENKRHFLEILLELEEELNIRVHPNLNLKDIISKKDYKRGVGYTFDFALFNNDYSKILLLIEINDNIYTSELSNMQIINFEDNKETKNLCDEMNMKLITFYSEFLNEKKQISNKIKRKLFNQK